MDLDEESFFKKLRKLVTKCAVKMLKEKMSCKLFGNLDNRLFKLEGKTFIVRHQCRLIL